MSLDNQEQESSQAQEHVQITPLGLSVEQMQISNPDAVAGIKSQAADAARVAERERLAGISAAFGSDPEFVAECVASGISVTEAKAKRYDVLAAEKATIQAENTRLATENAALKVRIDATKIGFDASDKGDGKPVATDLETRIEAAWSNSAAQQKFNGDKTAFVALMNNDQTKLLKYEPAATK